MDLSIRHGLWAHCRRHNFTQLLQRYTQPEMKILGRRIGYANLFNEVMAANYYELDLSESEQRWVCQELVHLAAVEPGIHCIEVSLQVSRRMQAGGAAVLFRCMLAAKNF